MNAKLYFKIIITLFSFFLLNTACNSSQLLYDKNDGAPQFNINETIANFTETDTNQNKDFYTFISGVNSVVVATEENLEVMFDNENEFYRRYHKLMKNYLSGIGFENIAITQKEQNKIENDFPLEKITYFNLTLDNTENYISKINMIFKSCNGDEFNFVIDSDYYINSDWDSFLFSKMKEMYWLRIKYNPANSLVVKKEMTKWNKTSLKTYFDENENSDLEGIYEKYGIGISETDSKYSIALIKENDNYKIIYLDGAKKSNNWIEGELKGTFSKTSIKDFYKVKWIMSDKSINENVYLTTSKYNFLELDFLNSEYGFKTEYLKMYPNVSDKINTPSNFISSGSGFFISEDGYLVTNHHIVKDAKTIVVQFKNNNILKEFNADIFYDDRKNDLTLLKIKNFDYNFSNGIPFQISQKEFPIGTSVFTLGFPLIETMGESVKLSDGIISSDYGYMSKKSVYQVTVPINPGNSGGPLFDKNGNLVGIINAKYTGAENVTYAIKSKILFEILNEKKMNNSSLKKSNLKNLSFVDQVKILDEIVCLIKVYN